MNSWSRRITIDPEHRDGQPCIRGMQIRVTDILDLLAAGVTHDELLKELPDLEQEDIRAALKFATEQINTLSGNSRRSWDRSFMEIADVEKK